MQGNDEQGSEQNDIFEFDCPECGAHIVGETDKCPKCGIEFIIEEVPESECPSCGKMVAIDGERCPECGEPFVADNAETEEDLKQQFPILVAEVKPLLILAKDYDIDVGDGRRLIDKAVKAGKQRDLITAVQMIREARSSIRLSLEEKISYDIQYLERLSEVAKRMGSDPLEIEDAISALKVRNTEGDFEGALAEAAAGRVVAEKLTGKYVEAHDLVESLSKMIDNCEYFYLDVRDAKRMLVEAREAGEHNDWSMMGILARKGREEVNRALPELLQTEMRKAKNHLLDAKAEGKDVSVLVKILKNAGVAMNREKYDEALDLLRVFKSELKRL